MKAHVGSDAHTGIVRSIKDTAANVAEVTQVHHPLHGDKQDVSGDAGYQGAKKRRETLKADMDWYTAMRRSQRRLPIA